MKRLPLFITAGMLAFAAAAPFAQSVFAATTDIPPDESASPPSEYPIGERVVVTVDPQCSSDRVKAGDANIITGLTRGMPSKGSLLRKRNNGLS